MNKRRTISRLFLLAAIGWLAACTSTSVQPPAGASGSPPAGLPGSSGASGSRPVPGPSPSSAKSGSAPSASGSGAGQSGASNTGVNNTGSTAGSAPAGDPGAIFDKSLGDFDGEIGREREAMAKAGQGTSRSAEKSQSSDTSSVKTAGRGAGGPDIRVSIPGGGLGFPGSVGGIGAPGGIGGEPSGRAAGGSTPAGSGPDRGKGPADAGVGPDGAPGTPDDPGPADRSPGTGGAGSGTPRPDANGGSGGTGDGAGTLPGDIPRDGAGEDQVARQLREAALAEKDPAIREALWDEYRKIMGIRKK